MADILLLETDRQLAAAAAEYFGRAGHALKAYSDPQQAVLSADTTPPDVIILDLFLANRSGIEFLYELRSYPDWQDVPVIITGRLGADELQDFKNSFKELGIAKYLPKQASSLAELLSEAEKVLRPVSV